MDLWNWNFNLEYKSVYDNAWFWPYDSNQRNNDIYEQNVAKLKIVGRGIIRRAPQPLDVEKLLFFAPRPPMLFGAR